MSQATRPDTTIPTRRALLAGAPAAAVALAAGAVANGLAIAAASPSAADPIFAMIEQHRKVWNERARLHELFMEHEDEPTIVPTGIIIGECPEPGWKRIEVDGLIQMCEFRTGKMLPVVARTEEQIVAGAPRDLIGPERDAWIKSKTNELRRRDAIERAHYEKTPRSLTWNAWNEVCKVAEAVTKQLVDTRPTTIGGVAAALAYWSEIASECDDTDLDCTVEFLEGLTEALAKIDA
jgi:hypothetical protein